MKNWYAIVNPVAGLGKGKNDWPIIKDQLVRFGIGFDPTVTERKYHSFELTVSAIRKGYRRILVIGGDGTLNEVVNGIFFQTEVQPHEITIGIVGVGAKNGWMPTESASKEYLDCIQTIKEGKTILQDVGKVDFFESRINQSRYFVNTAGIGLQANLALATNRIKERGQKGKALYIMSLIKEGFVFRPSAAKIQIDKTTYTGAVFSVKLSIGECHNLELLPTPLIYPNDSFFDVTIVSKISRYKVFLNLCKLYNGKIWDHSDANVYQGRVVRVSSRPPFNLEIDGESLGTSPFSFSILPRSLRVVVPSRSE